MPGERKELFTVILDFEGTNSVSQFTALTPDEALREWHRGLDRPVNYNLKPDRAHLLSEALRREWKECTERPSETGTLVVALSEVKNVWCLWLALEDTSALINIVATLSP